VWASTRGTTVYRADGTPTHIVSHFHDITAIKLAEIRQAEATARFETAFADAPIGMAIVGLDGRWLRVNRMLCELSGYTEEQLRKLTFQDLTHPDDLDDDLEQIKQLLTGEIARYTVQKRYYTAQGS
jgi:two-component system, sensor histidine kinase and response regulator